MAIARRINRDSQALWEGLSQPERDVLEEKLAWPHRTPSEDVETVRGLLKSELLECHDVFRDENSHWEVTEIGVAVVNLEHVAKRKRARAERAAAKRQR